MINYSNHKISFPPIRKATVDLLRAAKRKNMIHSMVEMDISRARTRLRRTKREKGLYISFTGYIIRCVARVVGDNRHMHAYRNRRGQLVLFDEVDVSTTIERRIGGRSEVVAMIIRGANRKPAADISAEIREESSRSAEEAAVYRSMRLFLAIPALFRRAVFRMLDRSPKMMKRRAGTIMVTSANLVGKGAGWGMPVATHTLNVTIGGIVDRVVEKEGRFESREHLCLTISFDHDIIDGAPAARFIRHLKREIERGEVED